MIMESVDLYDADGSYNGVLDHFDQMKRYSKYFVHANLSNIIKKFCPMYTLPAFIGRPRRGNARNVPVFFYDTM